MPETEIQPADPQARRRAVRLLVVVALIAAAALWLVQNRLDAVLEPAGGPDLEAARTTLTAISSLAGAGLIGIALWMIALGRRIEGARRFPPPEMRVIQDTAVRRGAQAVRLAYLLYAGAAVLFVGGIAIPFRVWRLLGSLVTP
ncbi:MAG: hypothetical protein R3244_03610 [Thermoanaerobaculia bacterium]|nr:hypothetical protein [Thermoanaerobaculia bacterium]